MDSWYIIETTPNAEEKAARELRRAGLRVYLPKLSRVRRDKKTGRERITHRPLWSGYILARFPQEMVSAGVPMFGVARKCQGVRDFVRYSTSTGDKPFPVPAKEVADLMRRQRDREFGKVALDSRKKTLERRREIYQRGRKVRVMDGPFGSFIAKIDNLRKSGEVEATIILFGRPTRIIMEHPEKTLKPI